MPEPKVLIYDIEMSYALMFGYPDSKPAYVSPDRILHRQYMICAAWKWYGEDKIHTVSTLDDPERFKKNFRDDYHVVKTLADEVNKADAVVAYNGNSFDIKELNTGLLKHKLPPLNQVITIDPFRICTRFFRMSAKGGFSLRNMCNFLDVGVQKGDTTEEQRQGAALGCKESIKAYVEYNIGDIPTLEAVWERVKPYAPAQLNMNHYVTDSNGNFVKVCPSCGGSNYKKSGWFISNSGITRKQRYQCLDCKKKFSERKGITVDYR